MTTEFVNFGFKGVFARSVAKYNKKKKFTVKVYRLGRKLVDKQKTCLKYKKKNKTELAAYKQFFSIKFKQIEQLISCKQNNLAKTEVENWFKVKENWFRIQFKKKTVYS